MATKPGNLGADDVRHETENTASYRARRRALAAVFRRTLSRSPAEADHTALLQIRNYGGTNRHREAFNHDKEVRDLDDFFLRTGW